MTNSATRTTAARPAASGRWPRPLPGGGRRCHRDPQPLPLVTPRDQRETAREKASPVCWRGEPPCVVGQRAPRPVRAASQTAEAARYPSEDCASVSVAMPAATPWSARGCPRLRPTTLSAQATASAHSGMSGMRCRPRHGARHLEYRAAVSATSPVNRSSTAAASAAAPVWIRSAKPRSSRKRCAPTRGPRRPSEGAARVPSGAGACVMPVPFSVRPRPGAT